MCRAVGMQRLPWKAIAPMWIPPVQRLQIAGRSMPWKKHKKMKHFAADDLRGMRKGGCCAMKYSSPFHFTTCDAILRGCKIKAKVSHCSGRAYRNRGYKV